MNEPANPTAIQCRNERILFWSLLVAALLLGLGARFSAFLPAPMNYHLVRQYAGIVNARVVRLFPRGVPDGSVEAAWLKENRKSLVEPPVLEMATLATRTWDGSSWPWAGCVLSSVFWLAGASFLFDLVNRLTRCPLAAVGSVAFYLLCPFAIVISQSFQPEGLMILVFLVSLWCLARLLDDRWSRVLATGLINGLAVAVKPGILLFPLFGGYVGLRLSRDGWKRVVRDPRAYVHALLLVLPSLLYASLFLREHFGTKIVPHLLLTGEFYVLWGTNLRATVSWIPLACALVGFVFLSRDFRSHLGVGLFVGYVLYALVFSWHTATHDYYQAPLVPIVALGIGGLVAKIVQWAPPEELPLTAVVVLIIVVLFGALSFSREAYKTIAPDARVSLETVCDFPGLGVHIPPGTRVICLDGLYGLAMAYHAWALVEYWPTGPDYIGEYQQTGAVVTLVERFKEMLRSHQPTRFVITSKPHLRLDQELGKLLEAAGESPLPDEVRQPEWDILLFLRKNFPRVAQSPNWIVYDLTRSGTTPPANEAR